MEKNNKKYAEIAANPEAAINKASEAFAPLADVAPKTAQVMSERAMRAANFIYEKMPKNPNSGDVLQPNVKKWMPSDFEISKWKRYVEATDNPLSAIKSLKEGKMTLEQADALKNVYPKLYQSLVGNIMEEITKLKDELPYKKRLQLGILFGIPSDPSLQPKFIQDMQAAHMKENQINPQEKGMASGVNLSFAQNAKTGTERVMTRN